MRNVVRIENFLNKVDIKDLIINIWKFSGIDIQKIVDNIETIKEEWLFMPDLRFSQMLVNLGYVPNIPGAWYYYEEDEILNLQGYKPREYIYWGNIYDKDKNKLPEVNYILVKDLGIDHMQTLIDGKWLRKDSDMYKIISDELLIRSRKEKLKKLNTLK